MTSNRKLNTSVVGRFVFVTIFLGLVSCAADAEDDLDNFPKSLSEARVYFQTACDGGADLGGIVFGMDEWSCRIFAKMAHDGIGGSQNQAIAREYWKKGCKGADRFSCDSLASAFRRGEGSTRDLSEALKYYRLACDLGFGSSCASAAEIVTTDNSEAPSEDALKYHFKACLSGERVACDRYVSGFVASISSSLPPGTTDVDVLRALNSECLGQSPSTCCVTAKMLEKAQEKPSNLSDTNYYWEMCCDGGVSWGCEELIQGSSADSDSYEMISLEEDACNSGSAMSCRKLGSRYKNGNGTVVDIPESLKYLARACEIDADYCVGGGGGGVGLELALPKCEQFVHESKAYFDCLLKWCMMYDGKSCFQLALAVEKGKLGQPNITGAIDFYRKACDVLLWNGCFKAGKLLLSIGHQDRTTIADAAELFSTACLFGNGWSCWRVAGLQESGKLGSVEADDVCSNYRLGCIFENSQAASCRKYGLCLKNGVVNQSDQTYMNSRDYLKKSCRGLDVLGCILLLVSN